MAELFVTLKFFKTRHTPIITKAGVELGITYADDMVMIADSEEKLGMLMDKLMLECNRMGLRINKAKTEVMRVTKCRERLPETISVKGTALKQVESFRYLGSLVCEDARCDKEITARIEMVKSSSEA